MGSTPSYVNIATLLVLITAAQVAGIPPPSVPLMVLECACPDKLKLVTSLVITLISLLVNVVVVLLYLYRHKVHDGGNVATEGAGNIQLSAHANIELEGGKFGLENNGAESIMDILMNNV